MSVKVLDRLPLENLPDHAQRPRDDGGRQLLTTYLLEDVLKPRRSEEAAALLGFVAEDLWPGEGWNYVFGQASLQERVGVWSLFRNGDPDGDADEARLCQLRTLKTAVHETGHMLGIPHCIAYACCMNGSNHLEESDRAPLEFCPECQAKLWWTCKDDPQERYRRLIKFSEGAGLESESQFWRKLGDALSDK
jgi:archaemetzincin